MVGDLNTSVSGIGAGPLSTATQVEDGDDDAASPADFGPGIDVE
jgi:hypothetical protein